MQKCSSVSFGSYSLFIIKHRQQQLCQQKKQNFRMMEIKRIKKKGNLYQKCMGKNQT